MAWVEQYGENLWRVRYRGEGGAIPSIPGFTSVKDAEEHAADMESDQRRGTWIDPTGGQTLLAEFVADWLDALDVDPRTEDNYRSMLRNHILPRWGTHPLSEITGLKVHAWAKKLRAGDLADVTVTGIIKLLSMILSDAADEKLIPANPIRPRRRGRRHARSARPAKKVWAEPAEVLHIADQIATYYHPRGALMVVTAAWTGERWGELAGLQRPNSLLFDDDTGHLYVHPEIGALHESNDGTLWLGPPKNDPSVREVTLPPFLVRLLRADLDTHHHSHLFTTPEFELHRRSNFSRRAMRPCADGNLRIARPRIRLAPVKPALTFHGLRHSHKTWMIDDNIPEIAQALRLGHILKDEVRETYSHVAPAVEARLLQCLQDRWEKAVVDNAATTLDTSWRDAA